MVQPSVVLCLENNGPMACESKLIYGIYFWKHISLALLIKKKVAPTCGKEILEYRWKPVAAIQNSLEMLSA